MGLLDLPLRKVQDAKLCKIEENLKVYTHWHCSGKKGYRKYIKELTNEKAILLEDIGTMLIRGKTYFELDAQVQVTVESGAMHTYATLAEIEAAYKTLRPGQ